MRESDKISRDVAVTAIRDLFQLEVGEMMDRIAEERLRGREKVINDFPNCLLCDKVDRTKSAKIQCTFVS